MWNNHCYVKNVIMKYRILTAVVIKIGEIAVLKIKANLC